MGIFKRMATCAVALLIASATVSASGFENSGVGVRARALGGAFRAIASDWTAAYYNPAGYAFQFDNQVGSSFGFMHFRNEITPTYRYGATWESGMINDHPLANKHEVLSVPSGGIVLRLPILGQETVVGLSAYQPFDYNQEWTLFEGLLGYNDDLRGNLPINQYVNNLDVVAFQLTLAREVTPDKLSLGIGLQVLRADLNFNDITLRENPRASAVSGGPVINDRPRDRIIQYTKNSGFGYGFGLNGGLLYKATEELRIAATFNYPFDITVDGEASATFLMPYNVALEDATSPDYLIDNMFVNGESQFYHPRMKADITLPPSIGMGLSYTLTDELTISLDAVYTFWSQFEGLDFVYRAWDIKGLAADPSIIGFFTADMSYPTEFTDAGKVNLGITYIAKSYMTLLGGFGIDQSANRNVVGFIPQFMDTGDKLSFSGGVIFNVDRWELGLATVFTNHPDLNVSTLEDLDDNDTFDTFPALYEAQTFETILAFTYRF
ncbi:MAG: outer membrane protein transport protein [candidate division Zixibacteria bacterium]